MWVLLPSRSPRPERSDAVSDYRLSPADFNGINDGIVNDYATGASISEIALKYGVSETKVRGLLRREFEKAYGSRQDVVHQNAATLQWAKRKLIERVKKMGDGFDRKDLELLVRCLERESRLLGLDAPTKVETKAIEQWTDEELLEECRRNGIPVESVPPLGAIAPLPPPETE